MLNYTFSTREHSQQYIAINLKFTSTEENTLLQLPSWRPGRYELGNFAKNVRNFRVFSNAGKKVTAAKINKDCWQLDCQKGEEILVEYLYYAADLNAGSTFLSKELLYVNPVNCCIYPSTQQSEACTIKLEIADDLTIVTSMAKDGKTLNAGNFEELVDSPFICSNAVQTKSYTVNDIDFYIHFIGQCTPDWDRVTKDFKAFTTVQMQKFTEFPAENYHFMIFVLPAKAYHGVEHLQSTVITLGPSHDLFEGYYKELLGISSHELYHAWNIKSIRPIEMFPYDYTKENYSRLGYLCEGVTTYQGDLMLYKSGVFDINQYFLEFSNQFQKHFDNHGRFNLSVADSSYDTWLDGYVPGAPQRKVSIYTEGCLLSFAIDVFIRRYTNDKYGLDEVMRRLYFDFHLQNKGVSEADYQAVIESVSGGHSFQLFFDTYINGLSNYEGLMVECLEYIGLELAHHGSEKYSVGRLGFKSISPQQSFVVSSIYPGSPAELGGLRINDDIIAVNKHIVNNDLDQWLTFFENEEKHLTVKRAGLLVDLTLPEVNRTFFNIYVVRQSEKPTNQQMRSFELWSK
jgi:predicted metalloprotease with PDZ domain